MLDTGAGFLAIDDSLAMWLGIADSIPFGGTPSLAPRALKRFQIGDHSIDFVQPIMTIDADVIRRVTDRPVLGLLGQRLYQDRALVLDYVARRVTMVPSAGHDAGSPALEASRVVASSFYGVGARAIPFRLAGDGKILVTARIVVSRFARSKPFTLVLDTGATKSTLFRSSLEELRVDPKSWNAICGITLPTLFGTPSACVVRVPRLELEGFVPHSAAAAEAGTPRETPPSNASTAHASKTTRRMRPAVSATLGGNASANANPATPVAKAQEDSANAVSDESSRTAADSAELRTKNAQDADRRTAKEPWRAETVAIRDHDAILMDSPLQAVLSQIAGESVHGLIGYSFLKAFRVTIDYPNRVLWLAPAADPDPRPFEYSTPGLQLERRGTEVRVTGVVEDSPAAAEGISVGDRVVSIDGRQAASTDLTTLGRALEGEPGSHIEIVVEGTKGVRTLKLQRRKLL
ncbi:MAG: PDZ domain-containing protein [Candidatus Eisenbacteria bacterium]|uniref:PDZ domain-containing protein n=1 Tax=Eiseniibacteriota bacterium TaxID=2212470 RepID=A0A849SQ00_UNCEI|nr:PDZ domain-containing protein [Candidatus Eisenbacteria bacterium]